MLGQQVRMSRHLSKYAGCRVQRGRPSGADMGQGRKQMLAEYALGRTYSGRTFVAKHPPSPLYLA